MNKKSLDQLMELSIVRNFQGTPLRNYNSCITTETLNESITLLGIIKHMTTGKL